MKIQARPGEDAIRAWFRPRRVALLAGVLFLLNLILKALFLDTVQIGLDEPFTIFHAQMPPGEMIARLTKFNNPPLYELLLHYWIELFGISPGSVRTLPLLFSSLTPVILFLIGNRIDRPFAGLVGALAFTLSREHIYFAHETRVYALFGLLTALSIYFLLGWKQNQGNWRRLIPLVICNTLLIYAHYFGFLVLLAEAVWVLLYGREKKGLAIKQFGIGLLLSGISFLPQLPTMLDRFTKTTGEHWVSLAKPASAYNAIAIYSNQPVTAVIALALLFAGAVTFFLRKQASDRQIILLLLFFPGCFLLLLLAGFKVPVFLDRYLVFTTIAFFLLLGISADYIGRKPALKLGLAAVMLLALAASTTLKPDKKSQWREVATYIQQERIKPSNVLISPKWSYRAYLYHYNREWFQDYKKVGTIMAADGTFGILPRMTLDSFPAQLQPRLYLITAGDFKSELHPEVRTYLDQHYRQTKKMDALHGIRIVHFESK